MSLAAFPFNVAGSLRAAVLVALLGLASVTDAAASADVEQMTAWIARSGDSRQLPFAIIDKKDARLYVFDARGRLKGSSAVLLGSARGDDSVPGIGERRIADILPHERTTPAGRFLAERGQNIRGEDIIWVDYDAAVSMHRVRANDPAEQRLQRLASSTPDDNRISYGCINVPYAFYNRILKPMFSASDAVVYVLPETRPLQVVFGD